MVKGLQGLLDYLDNDEALGIAAARAFQTAAEKMGKKCPLCLGDKRVVSGDQRTGLCLKI